MESSCWVAESAGERILKFEINDVEEGMNICHTQRKFYKEGQNYKKDKRNKKVLY